MDWQRNDRLGGTTFDNYLNTGGRYDPGTDSWTRTNTTNAPGGRRFHTAVWTDSEMIVWGGFDQNGVNFNTGGRYNPSTDSWTTTSTTNVPTGRWAHAAVWSDSEMIVWGGFGSSGFLNTGGRYNPGTDSWMTTSTTKAPTGEYGHTAVWAGTEMIVWGGYDGSSDVNTGGRYCAQAGSPTITLSAAKRKVEGINTVRLTWSGATSTDIDVYRCTLQMGACDLELIATTPNTGSYTDSTGDTGRARYKYRVCEAGTSICSDIARVRFQH